MNYFAATHVWDVTCSALGGILCSTCLLTMPICAAELDRDPQLLGRWTAPEGVRIQSAAFSSDYAYIGGQDGLTILDLRSPQKPIEKGFLPIAAGAGKVALASDHAYVVSRENNQPAILHVINVSDPANPVEISSLSPLGRILDIVVSGGYAYLVGTDELGLLYGAEVRMMVLDVRDPSEPQVVLDGFHPTEYRYGLHLAVAGDQLSLSDSLWNLQLTDVSNPADPQITGSLEGVGGWMAQSPGYAYVEIGNWLRIFNISDPNAPFLVGSSAPPYSGGCADGVAVADSTVVMPLSDDSSAICAVLGVQILDVSEPANPRRIGCYVPVGFPDPFLSESVRVGLSGHYAYLAFDNASPGVGGILDIVDLSVPANPQRLSAVTTGGDARQVAALGDYAFVANSQSGLSILDVSDPATPNLRGIDNYASSVGVSGEYAYLLHSSPSGCTVQVLDMSDPENPSIVASSREFSAKFRDYPSRSPIVLSDGLAFAGDAIIDITNPASPQPLGRLDSADGVFLAVSGNYAYADDWGTPLSVVNISDPANPQHIARLETTDFVMAVCVVGDVAYLIESRFLAGRIPTRGLLEVLNMADPANPELLGSYELRSVGVDGVVSGSLLYIMEEEAGVEVFDISDPRNPHRVGGNSGFKAVSAALLPDGRVLVAAGYDGLAVLNPYQPPPSISISTPEGSGGRQIQWDRGRLQFSTEINGPWIDLPAASPMPLSPIGEKGFFRVKVEP